MATTRSSPRTEPADLPEGRTESRVEDGDGLGATHAEQREGVDYRALVETFADAVVAADEANRIVYVNPAAEALFGWAAEDLIGQPLTVIQPPRLRRAHTAAFSRYMDTGASKLLGRQVRVPALRRDGTEVEVELSIAATQAHSRGRRLVFGSLRDLSDRVELERQLEVMRLLRASTFAGAKLGSLLDLDQVLQDVVETLVTDFGSILARIWLYEPDGGALRLKASAGRSQPDSDALLAASLDAGIWPYEVEQVVTTRQRFVRNTLRGDPDFDQDWVKDAAVGAVAAYPILVGEELRGVVAHFTPDDLGDEAVEVLANYVTVVAASLHDVELLAREQALRARADESLSLLDALFATAPVGLAYWDRQLRYVRINDSLAAINGVPAQEHIGRTVEEVLPKLGPAVAETLRCVIETGREVVNLDVTGETPAEPGRQRTWLASYYPVRQSSGEVIGVGGVITDVTERKRSADALRESEERFRLLVEGVRDYAIFMHDTQGRIASWNAGAERIMGYAADEIVGQHFARFYPPEDIEAGKPELELTLALRSGRVETEGWRVRKDGSRFFANVVITPLRDESGNLRGYSKVLRDVSEQKRAEDRLRFLADASAVLSSSLDYQATLSQVVELAVPALADWAAVDIVEQGTIHRLAVTHRDPTKLQLARELQERYPPDQHALHGVPNVIRSAKPEFAAEVPDALLRALAADDEHLALLRRVGLRSYITVPLLARDRTLGALTLVSSESGRVYGREDLAIAEDVARRAAIAVDNARLYREAQEAIGARDEFLSLASHELRTPVTILHAYTQALSRSVTKAMAANRSDGEPEPATVTLDRTRLSGNMEAMTHAIGRLVALIEDLLDVSRLQRGSIEINRVRTDLSELLGRVVEGFQVQQQQGRISDQLVIQLEQPESGRVLGDWDPDRLDQVFANLVENAVKYSGPQGEVTVGVQVEPMDGEQGQQAHISVRDQGIGIPPDQLELIFQPYSRATNASIRNYPGFGMGLAVAKEIIERLGGRIWVESGGEDKGSTFHAVLPGAWLEG